MTELRPRDWCPVVLVGLWEVCDVGASRSITIFAVGLWWAGPKSSALQRSGFELCEKVRGVVGTIVGQRDGEERKGRSLRRGGQACAATPSPAPIHSQRNSRTTNTLRREAHPLSDYQPGTLFSLIRAAAESIQQGEYRTLESP